MKLTFILLLSIIFLRLYCIMLAHFFSNVFLSKKGSLYFKNNFLSYVYYEFFVRNQRNHRQGKFMWVSGYILNRLYIFSFSLFRWNNPSLSSSKPSLMALNYPPPILSPLEHVLQKCLMPTTYDFLLTK